MPCTSPLKGYKDAAGLLSFSSRGSLCHMQVACGQCMGCRVDRSRAWAIRCVHESNGHEDNCFITLTYSPENLPAGGTLVKKHFQDFIKRLRESISPKKISFFHCGEYGDQLMRPHYHGLLFGHDFEDKRQWKKSHDGSQLFTSAALEHLWGKGFCSIGAVSYATAAYCSAYILKKITGDRAKTHYQRITSDGEIVQLEPEYITMSTRPAIGLKWIKQYHGEVYQNDNVIMKGSEKKPPRYYDKYLKSINLKLYEETKLKRKERSHKKEARWNNTPKRLLVRAEVLASKISLYKRELS